MDAIVLRRPPPPKTRRAESVVGRVRPQLSLTGPPRLRRRLWRYAWASPASLLGLAVGGLAVACGATARRIDGVLEIAGGSLAQRATRWPLARHFCALTLGHVVLGRDHAVLDACRLHEQAHVAQYERWGPAFLVLYAASSAWEAAKGNSPYFDNHFERQARAAAASCPAGDGTRDAL